MATTGGLEPRRGRRRSERSLADGDARGRVPPHDLEAEKAVLSAILLDSQAIHAVYTEVKPGNFYHPAHRALYEAMVAIKDRNDPLDLHTLSDHLNAHKILDSIGGPVFLAEIADYESTAAHVIHHARIVRDKSIKRELISAAVEIVELGFDQPGRADQLLDVAEARILDIGRERGQVAFRSLHDEMHDTFDFVDMLRSRGGQLTGLPTGFRDLDDLTGGFQNGDLIIIAARPSMGKTALALNIARNAAVDHGKKVAIFSLEMTTRALVLRLLSAEASIDFATFRKGHISHHAYVTLQQAAGVLHQAPIWIDDSGSPTVLEMKAKSRRLKSEVGLDALIVDYMQLTAADGYSERREQEISEVSRNLKGLAKELEIPVIALSQLNRGPELREDKHPRLADLRESGAIEQDADVIAFIYRGVVYDTDPDPDEERERHAELVVAKQRNGPTDTIHLDFEKRFARFASRTARSDGPLPTPEGFVPPEGSLESEPPF